MDFPLTPTEEAARELIAAAESLGVRHLSNALGRDTEARLRELLTSGIETEGQDPAEGLGAEHESPTGGAGDAQ